MLAPTHAKEKRVYRVATLVNRHPYAFVSLGPEGKTIRGAYIDVLNLIAQRMHAQFTYIKSNDFEMSQELVERGEADIIGWAFSVENSKFLDHYSFIPSGLVLTSHIFVHDSCNHVVCAKDLTNKRIAVVSGGPGLWPFDVPEHGEIFPVHSQNEGLKMLNEGLVEAFISPSEEIAQSIIVEEGYENVRRVGVPLRTIPIGIAIPEGQQKLYQELKDAAEFVKDSGMLGHITDKWFGVEYKTSLVKRYRYYIYSFIGGAMLLSLAVIFWNYLLKKKVQSMTDQLQRSESRYRNLIESSPDMMFVINREGVIELMNKEARYSVPARCLEGNGDACLNDVFMLNADDNDVDFRVFLDELFTNHKQAKSFRLRNSLAAYRDVDVVATLLQLEADEQARACLFARDVTERNRIERDLVQADRMAIIGQMAADVAHEINNPIGIIRANIDLILAKGWHTEEAREFLESCKRNTNRAGEFTHDLLAIAKPKTPELKDLQLWDLVLATLDMMGVQLKHVKVTTLSKGRKALIKGDWNLLQQVLVNLLLNAAAAVKSQPNPAITITCCVPTGSDMVRLKIEDKGVGIERRHLREIFEPFFTMGKKEGFGLGLFISKRVVENHNGIIYAESEMGKGTLMVIEMPLLSADETDAEGRAETTG